MDIEPIPQAINVAVIAQNIAVKNIPFVFMIVLDEGIKKKDRQLTAFFKLFTETRDYSPLPSIFSFNAANAPISPNVDFST